jgi:sigma-E factor negative regulatory protein RseA
MEKISQLMDGELGARESRSQIQRIETDPELSDGWETYHLIRDALRNEVDVGPQFVRRLHARLEQEPAIVAPHTRLPARVVRYTLPMAAGIAGVAVVGWLALSNTPMTGAGGGVQTVAQQSVPPAATAPAAPAPAAPVNGQVRDYMLAHQEFSPSTAMQGVASYVRTVSEDTPGQ